MKLLKLLLPLVLALSANFSVYAAEDDHIDEALKHAKEAADASTPADIMKHVDMSKNHAKTASEHLNMALTSLDSAAEHAKLGHADMAKAAAKEAVTHLKAVDD
ncbi:small metal-binding protein SmbP [Crenothrix sp.]|uniref:small metal-binding protein SmbP n=1 Tax=Crenothrix sp. TaxID=3100433 RepID=UPI00374C8DFC